MGKIRGEWSPNLGEREGLEKEVLSETQHKNPKKKLTMTS